MENKMGFRKGKETRCQISHEIRIAETAKEYKEIDLCSVNCEQTFESSDPGRKWNILRLMGMAELLVIFLGNFYNDQETIP